MEKMTFDTLLRAAVLIIPQGVLKRREVKKHFWTEIAARVHLFVVGSSALNPNQFCVNHNLRELIFTTFESKMDCINYRLCTKVCTKLARLILY